LPIRFWLFTKNKISHFVRNDKPVVVDKGEKKGGFAAFLFSLPLINIVCHSERSEESQSNLQNGNWSILQLSSRQKFNYSNVQLFYYSIVQTNEQANI